MNKNILVEIERQTLIKKAKENLRVLETISQGRT